MNQKPRKIHICGIYGSGKTTLAKKISERLNIPVYSLDDIRYIVKYSKTRSVKERIKRVKEIARKKRWIIEGTWSNYCEDAFKKADLIILMKVPKYICRYRILKRYFSRNKEETDSFLGALNLARKVGRYYSSDQPVSLKAHQDLIKKHRKRFILIKSKKEADKLLNEL